MAAPLVQILASPSAVADAAATFAAGVLSAAAAHRRASVMLAGGRTPSLLYERLAQTPDLPWGNLDVYWGDERCVPPDHAESNYRMARVSLLDRVPVQADRVFRVEAERGPEVAAADYDRLLRERCERPDLIILGMGADGHTASLFPGTAACDETERRFVAHHVPAMSAPRLTITLPVIAAARNAMFVVTGREKAGALRDVLEPSDAGARPLPAARARPEAGELRWFIDAAAAALLERR